MEGGRGEGGDSAVVFWSSKIITTAVDTAARATSGNSYRWRDGH